MATIEIWAFRDQSYGSIDLSGYKVEAIDGDIGKVDEATTRSGRATSSSTPVHGSSGRR